MILDKFVNLNNNIVKLDDIKIKPKLIENKMQLTDAKKIKFGFDLNDSVIDVVQDGYSICYGEDILYTYGMDPCCGLVLCDGNVRILFHLDGSISPQDVLDITDKVNLSPNAMAIVIPGASCGMPGSFNYKQIEEDYKKRGYEVISQRIPATFGFVILDSDKVTIGTGIDRSLDVVLPIPKRKIQVKSSELNGDTIQKLIDFKKDLLNSNNYVSGKRR